MNNAKRFVSLLLSLYLVLGLLPGVALAAEGGLPFTDVKAGDWYYEAVQYAHDKGMMSGTGDTTFAPGESTTRGMIVTVLYRLEKQPAVAAAGKFPDVAAGQWYADPVAWASEKGIVNGYDNGNFGPMDPITREQMAAILYRYAQFKGYDTAVSGDINAFADYSQVSPYAVDAMKWAVSQGLISGMENNTLAPQGNATRGQIAAVLMRYDQKVVGATTPQNPTKPTEPTKPGATTPSGGGGGGGGGGTTPTKGSISLTADKTVEGSSTTVPVGAKITASISNPNSATVVWLIGGAETTVTGNVYEVKATDLGKEIQVKLVKEDKDEASSNKYTVEKSTQTTLDALKGDTAPVKLAEGTTFKDAEGKDVTVDATSQLVLSVEPKAESEITDAQKSETKTAVKTDVETKIQEAVTAVDSGKTLSDTEKADLAAATQVLAVDVDLTLVEKEGDQTKETEIHPVGETTVKLSASQLGLAGEDLNLYHLVASHTNAAGVSETDVGEVNEAGTEVTFTTNGLSTIWIGNVPPRTVKFNTDGGSEVAPQKVRFGSTVDTNKVGTPTKAGYLFCGWNFDLAKTPIIYDMTVDAKWVQGKPMPNSSFTVTLNQEVNDLEFVNDVAGKYTIKANPDATYAADILAKADVKPYTDATQYVASASAETAANTTDATQFMQIGEATTIPMAGNITVTNAEGKIVAGKTPYYVKWMDAEGKVLALEELIVIVDDGKGAADKMVVTREINRGVGTFEPYLTSSDKTGAPKWVGYINGDPERQYTNNSNEWKYRLRTTVSFEQHFNNQEYAYTDYDIFHMEFKPFTGESYTGKTVSAQAMYSDENHQQQTVNATASVNSETGRLEVSIPLSALNEPVTSSWINFTMQVTVGDATQEIWVETRNPKYQDAVRNWQNKQVATLEELRAALTEVSSDTSIYWTITYTGEADLELTNALTIPQNVHLNFTNVSFIVGNGGVLTMESGEDRQSSIQINNMEKGFTVANGGKLIARDTRSGRPDRIWTINVSTCNLIVADGGIVEIGAHTVLHFDGWNYDEHHVNSTCTLEAGSKVTLNGENGGGHFGIFNFETVSLDGTIQSNENGYLYVHSDYITIGGTIQAVSSSWSNVEFYGDVTVTATGKIQASGRNVNLNLMCPLTNKGEIKLENGAYGILTNTGFVQRNDGTISIDANSEVNLEGTKLVNTGTITGSGTVYAMLGDDLTDYAANHTGLDYVKIDPGTTIGPDNYSRYQFTGEPDKTIQVTLYKGDISNEQDGKTDSTVKMQTEDFPQE